MHKLTRRTLIRRIAAAGAWLPASLLLAAPTGTPDTEEELGALGPYLDTLLPADETPAATQLQIDQLILQRAGTDKNLLRLLTLGCAWLDARAIDRDARPYSELEPTARMEIVREAEASSPRTLQRVFFEQTRGLAFHLYYARPEAWRGLAYAGPPQPRGFPDFNRPPVTPEM